MGKRRDSRGCEAASPPSRRSLDDESGFEGYGQGHVVEVGRGSLAAIISRCQFVANAAWGLSSEKQR